MSGLKSRRKGKAFERWLVNRLLPYFPDAERGWWQAGGGARVPDVTGTGPYWIEAEHAMHPSPHRKMAQAVGYTNARVPVFVIPVVVTKKTLGDVLVSMRLDDWLNLIGKSDPARRNDGPREP